MAKYIAVNGDDVGAKIGEAIGMDDHDSLRATTDSIKQSHGMIEEWIENNGGEIVTSTGDEGIYSLPEEAMGELENIRNEYKRMSGNALTVGVGDSMSEASKALIYGKLNGKDQVVNYEPSIEDYLSEEDEEDEGEEVDTEAPEEGIPAEEEVEEQAREDLEEEIPEETPEMEMPEEDEEAPVEEEGMDGLAEGQEDIEDLGEDDIASPDTETSTVPEETGEMLEEGEEEMPPEEGIEPDMEGEMPEEGAIPEEADGESPYDDIAPETEGEEEMPPEEGEIPPGEMPPEEGEMPPGMEDEIPEEGEEMPPEEGEEMPPEEDEDAYDYNNALTDMIHGQMEGGEDQENPEESNDDDIRQDIASALTAFKQNKEMLEAAREQNPELYSATITMLRSMIEMAKKLGYAPEQDMEAQEAEESMVDEFPDAEAEMAPDGVPPEKKQ